MDKTDNSENTTNNRESNEFNIMLPSGPPLTPANQVNTIGLTPFVQPPPSALIGGWTPQQIQALATQVQNQMATGIMEEKTGMGATKEPKTSEEASSSSAASFSMSTGFGIMGNAGAGSGTMMNSPSILNGLDERDKKLAETILAFCNGPKIEPSNPKMETPGAKAKADLASDLAKKYNNIQSDVNRLVQCKVFKTKLVDRVFKPLDTRSIGMFMNVHHIPTWNTPFIQDKVKDWSVRGAEMLRQGLLMSVETEMAKLNSRRELIKKDEAKEKPDFEMVREVRKSLNL